MSRSKEDLGAGQSLKEERQRSEENIFQNGKSIIRKRNEHMIHFMKEYRNRQRIMETSKRSADHLVGVNEKDKQKNCEQNRQNRKYQHIREYMEIYGKIQRYKEIETPEEQESHRIEDQKALEKHRKNQKFLYMRAYMKEYRKIQRMVETPEEKAARLKKDRDSIRIKRQNKKREMVPKNGCMKEYMAEYRKTKCMIETAEKEVLRIEVNEEKEETNCIKVGRNEYGKVYMKEYRKRQRLTETPEEKETRLAKERLHIRIKRQNKRLLKSQNQEDTEKHEEELPRLSLVDKKHEEKLLRLSLLDKIRKHFSTQPSEDSLKKDTERKHLLDQKQIEILILKQCKESNAVGFTNFLPKGQYKALSQQISLHTSDCKIENKIVQETRLEFIAKQNQDFKQDKSGSLLECPELSLVNNYKFDSVKNDSTIQKNKNNNNSSCIEEAFDGMKKVIDLKTISDRYCIYGKHLANQIRNSGKSDKEICIAKQLIDNVIKNLNLDDGTS